MIDSLHHRDLLSPHCLEQCPGDVLGKMMATVDRSLLFQHEKSVVKAETSFVRSQEIRGTILWLWIVPNADMQTVCRADVVVTPMLEFSRSSACRTCI